MAVTVTRTLSETDAARNPHEVAAEVVAGLRIKAAEVNSVVGFAAAVTVGEYHSTLRIAVSGPDAADFVAAFCR